jgi:Bacteriophage Lambda NinG protein
LKRTPLKRKKSIKSTKSRGKGVTGLKSHCGRSQRPSRKSPSITQLKKKLWAECKRIVRARYANKDGTWNCYTCGKHLTIPFDAHTAHFIPKAACGTLMKFDLRNLRVCCYHCNINLGGNGSEFYRRLVRDEGQDYVDALFKDKNLTIKADAEYFKKKIEEYRGMETD